MPFLVCSTPKEPQPNDEVGFGVVMKCRAQGTPRPTATASRVLAGPAIARDNKKGGGYLDNGVPFVFVFLLVYKHRDSLVGGKFIF